MTPLVSVVLSVYNARAELPATLASVLAQQGCEIEVIAVDDGSGDGSGDVLREWAARDPRVRVLAQANQGLTRSLVRACAEARGAFIARQDVGDESLPGRLRAQAQLLQARADVAFVGCHYELVGPGRELLASPLPPAAIASEGWRNRDGSVLPNPHHGSVMFRKSAYLAAGGYRPAFRFAQDVDLWSRMIEQGDLAYVPEVLYRAKFDIAGITARHRPAQQALRALALRAAVARAAGAPEDPFLREAERIGATSATRGPRRLRRAAAAYFVASCLAGRGDPRARIYFRQALRSNPAHLKSWLRLASLWWAGKCAGRGSSPA